MYYMRLVLKFKTKDPDVAFAIINYANQVLIATTGLRIGKVCIDATSERFFAAILKQKLSAVGIAVELVDSSASIIYAGEKMNYKAYLGNLLCNDFSEGRIGIPEFEWLIS